MNYSETNIELFQTDDKIKLLSRQWITKKKLKAIFIAVHGGMAHSGDWEIPALYFKDKGISTYAFDLRWHGTYSQYNKNGKVFFHIDEFKKNVNDIHRYYLNIRKKYPATPVFIIGHSYGAALSLLYGLLYKEADIKGIIISSPWLKNKVYIPAHIRFLAKIINIFNPEYAVTTENLVEKLTHNKEMIKQHYADEKAGRRGTQATVSTGVEMIKMQSHIIRNIGSWDKYPLFAVVAGTDYLADAEVSMHTLKQIPENLLEMHFYEKNFHENYYEQNREVIFGNIFKWVSKILAESK